MSTATANAKRFKKGMMALTPLEGELLEMLEAADTTVCSLCRRLNPQHEDCTSCDGRDSVMAVIGRAHGED